jgi:hypothetical protein
MAFFKQIRQQPIFINGTQVPYANTAKYLGMTIDAKLWRKEHIQKKLLSSTSSSGKYIGCLDTILSCQPTINSYKQVICPVWSYGIQLWGCASDSNIEVIQCYQNKVLKCIVNAPWQV